MSRDFNYDLIIAEDAPGTWRVELRNMLNGERDVALFSGPAEVNADRFMADLLRAAL